MRSKIKHMEMNFKKFSYLFFIITTLTIASCTKDRIEAKKTETASFSSADDFYDKYKQQEQEFVIDSTAGGPIVGKMGTKIYLNKEIFMYPDGKDVTWPFTIKLIEIYPVKDIILYQLPSPGLESAAGIRVRAFKGTQELVLKPTKKYYMQLDSMPNLLTGMKVFYGKDSSSIIKWTDNVTSLDATINPDSLSSVVNLPLFYSMNIARMGWVNCARFYNAGAALTTVKFSVEGSNTENIDVFLVFKNISSVTQVYKLESSAIPVGTKLTVVAISRDENNSLVLHKAELTVSSNQTVPLNLVPITETDLLTSLSSL